jgi:adenylate cyclase
MNFFSELRRRNVYKVAVAYAVVAWLIIQAASILLPTFEAPAWVMKVIVLLLVLGFPAALVFSWAFEITPEGIVRETKVETSKSIAHHTGRKLVAVTIVVALIAGGLFVFKCFAQEPRLAWRAELLRRRTLKVSREPDPPFRKNPLPLCPSKT